MNIEVTYYGLIADKVGTRKEQLSIEKEGDLSALKSALETKYADLKGFVYKVALGDELIDDSAIIYENAKIALLPPYAGG